MTDNAKTPEVREMDWSTLFSNGLFGGTAGAPMSLAPPSSAPLGALGPGLLRNLPWQQHLHDGGAAAAAAAAQNAMHRSMLDPFAP